MKRIKKDDIVIITTGKSKGHVGKVLKVVENGVFVEGGNMVKKHMKPTRQDQQGAIVTREAKIHVSNVAYYNSVSNKADKIGFKYLENNGVKTKVRFLKSNNEVIDPV